MIPHDDKPQKALMLSVKIPVPSVLIEDALGDILDLLPDSFFKGKSLLGSTNVEIVHGVGGLVWEQGRRDGFFPSDTLRQFGHLVQAVKLFGCYMLESRLPFRSIQFHQPPERVVA